MSEFQGTQEADSLESELKAKTNLESAHWSADMSCPPSGLAGRAGVYPLTKEGGVLRVGKFPAFPLGSLGLIQFTDANTWCCRGEGGTRPVRETGQ